MVLKWQYRCCHNENINSIKGEYNENKKDKFPVIGDVDTGVRIAGLQYICSSVHIHTCLN
jgi:hypothetical protein